MEERGKLIIDHLGSPVMVVKYFYDTEVAKELKYSSFGQVIYDSAPDFDFPFRFAGGIYDEDTKLIRFGVRDYDPETGRWTSVEPLGFAGSKNWYVYAGNDGVNFVDLDGKKKNAITYIAVSLKNMTYQDKLARYMLQKLICKSIENNKEYGGSFAKDPYLGRLKYYLGTSKSDSHLKYPNVNAVFSLHTHGCWNNTNIEYSNGKYFDWNETYSPKDAKIVKEDGVPNYLGTSTGRMFYLEYSNKRFIMKVFPDLDLSNCKCPNKKPYNENWFPNKCGSLK